MAFTMDDVLEVLRIMRECDDAELRIEAGDLKLSLAKGAIAGSAMSASGFSPPAQPADVVPTTTTELTARACESGTAPAATAGPAAAQPGQTAIPEGFVPIRATVTSVFYRKPSPHEPPFVDVGSEVDEDTIVCLLDVMKCYHSVSAGVRGRIEKILVESGELVESGAAMFLVRPA